jgi:hypothetical protein
MTLEGVPGITLSRTPPVVLAEVGERVVIDRHDFTVEGEVTAIGFDPMRGNWVRLKRDDGDEIEIQEMVRLPFTITVQK